MIKTLILLLLVSSLAALAQKSKPAVEPLILRGKLTNSPEKDFHITFSDTYGEESIDTISLNPDGTFFLKTYRCTHPQIASIQQHQTQINDIYVAPGYDLFITGDATNFETLFASVKITGKGAATNRYRELKNEWYRNNKADTFWVELGKKSLVRFARLEKQRHDSLARVVFSGPAPKDDPYFDFFKRSILLDNSFYQLYYLMSHANMYQLSAAESEELVLKNIDRTPAIKGSHEGYVVYAGADLVGKPVGRKLVANVNDETYLISEFYRGWFLLEYRAFQVRMDYLKDPALKNDELYPLKKSAEIYSGRARDLSHYYLMSKGVNACQDLERLHALADLYKPYIADFKDDFYRKSLAQKFTARADFLSETSIGKPAPLFTLKNERGESHSLADFKGKVVYIDFWASWCKPCREETPFLESVYDQYKNDPRIAFVSVAVADGQQAWLNALKKDKPTWLQLIDSDGKIQAAYNANLIPRFVVVNKKGEIVNFNAPRPSHKEELLALLEKEIALE
jgi:thiol-disulfide isomerase/thioredoxin